MKNKTIKPTKAQLLKEETIKEIKFLVEQECASRNLGREHGISLDDSLHDIFLPKSDQYDDQTSNFVTGVVHDGIINYEGDASGFIPFSECSVEVLSDVLSGIEIEIKNKTVEICKNPFHKV